MYKCLKILAIFVFCVCCQASEDQRNDVLPNIKVYFEISYNLYRADLGYAGGYRVFRNQGLKGIIICNMGNHTFKAFDLACPHLSLVACKEPMDVNRFPLLVCQCDENKSYHIRVPYQRLQNKIYYLRTYRVDLYENRLIVQSF